MIHHMTAFTLIADIQSVITRWCAFIQMVIMQIQPHSPQNRNTHTHISEKCCWKKKKNYSCKKLIAKLRPHQMTGASQRESRAVTRERQNSNKQSSAYLSLFFFFDGIILFVTLHATKPCCFFTTKTLFLSVIYSITDTNNNSPWRNETETKE